MKPKDIRAAVREICLSLPHAEERSGKRMPDYLVRGKVFALLAVNHHGDGNTALWLPGPPGAQQLHADMAPEHYFVPPTSDPAGGSACTSTGATTGFQSRPEFARPMRTSPLPG